MEDRNTYIRDMLDSCLEDFDMIDDPQLRILNELQGKKQKKVAPKGGA